MEVVEGRATVEDVDAFLGELSAVGEATGTTVQAFDARYVVGRVHLERALTRAERAFERDENVARDRAMEVLLYAAGRRQIDRALAMGVDEGETRAVVLVDGDSDENETAALGAVEVLDAFVDHEPTLETQDVETLCDFFDVPDAEREATDAPLSALVRERVALLEVEK